jgi:D-alanine-D-alanine ligase
MTRLHVAVLRGGPSHEYDISLSTGNHVIKALDDKYRIYDIFISKEGIWHLRGAPRDPYDILKHTDVVVNALHGAYGEDGKLQTLLHTFHTPYTGSDALGSALAMNKVLSKKILTKHGIKTPHFIEIKNTKPHHDIANDIFKKIPFPVIIKPACSGSSIGVTIIDNFSSLELGIKKAFEHGDTAIVEEYIKGKEGTCGVIEGFRDQRLYSLLPVEIRHERDIHDFDLKCDNPINIVHSGTFSHKESLEIQRIAKEVHIILGLKHYSRSDFIVHPKRGIYLLEVNSLPGLAPLSAFTQSLHGVGSNLSAFMDHIIGLAIKAE